MSTMDYQDDTLVDYGADSNYEVDLSPLTGSAQYKNLDLFEEVGELYNVQAENDNLKSEIAQLQETNRITNEKRSEAHLNFQRVSDLAQRLNFQIVDLKNQIQLERSTHQAAVDEFEEKIKDLEDENDHFRVLQGATSPTVITPITPPKCKQPKSYGLPRTPFKNNTGIQIYYGGGKVRSIEAELQKACAASKFYSPGDSTTIDVSDVVEYGFHPGLAPERRAMILADEFEAVQEAYALDEPEWARPEGPLTMDEMDEIANAELTTPTQPKKSAQNVIKPKKIVSKKQAGRKTVATKTTQKPAPKRVIHIESFDEEPLLRTKGRSMGAAAQAQEEAEYEEESTGSAYSDNISDDDSEFEADDYEAEDWTFKCVCEGKKKSTSYIKCTLCKNWGHSKCYGLRMKDVTEEYVHLCPDHAAEAKIHRATTTNDKKRKRDSDGEGSQNDSSEYDESTGSKGKKPRPNAWTQEEKDYLVAVMRNHFNLVRFGLREEIYDANLFKLISQDLANLGVSRNANACKNIWNRELRAATGLDERRQKNPGKLVTSVQ